MKTIELIREWIQENPSTVSLIRYLVWVILIIDLIGKEIEKTDKVMLASATFEIVKIRTLELENRANPEPNEQ